MIKFLKKLTGSKNTNNKRFRQEMAKKLDGRHIKYVTERFGEGENASDIVIAKEGALIVKESEFLVYAASDVIFRTKIEDLDAWELLSLEGVVLTAPDMEHGGETRRIIAYYKYYR